MRLRRVTSNLPNTWTLLLLCGLAYVLYLMRFGYGFGTSDQDEFLPYLYQLLDPELFQEDWFVETQRSSFSVRTYFVYGLRGLCTIFPPWLAVFVVYLASWVGMGTAVFSLGYELTKDRLASAAAVVLLLVVTPFWTLGGNDLVHTMLVPSMVAWAIGLWGITVFLDKRIFLAAALLGVATLFQALVGLQLAFILGCALLFGMCIPTRSFLKEPPSLLGFSALYAISAAPALIPLFYQQFAPTDPSLIPADAPSLFYIMAEFRTPHHYLFESFNKLRMLQFASLTLAGCLALIWLRRNRSQVHIRCPLGFSVICAALWVVAYLGTEVYPITTINKLQLFKTSVLVKSIMGIMLCAGLIQLLPARVYRFFDKLLFSKTLILVPLTLIAALGFYLYMPDRFTEKVYPLSRENNPYAVVEDWIEVNTPVDAVVSVPPSKSSFRSQAKRAILINHKAFPYLDADIYVWFERLADFAPVDRPQRSDGRLISLLDEAYHALNESELTTLSAKYNFQYVIREAPLHTRRQEFEEVFRMEDWYVYRKTLEMQQ